MIAVSGRLMKRLSREHKKKRKRGVARAHQPTGITPQLSNNVEHVTIRAKRRPICTIYILEKEEPWKNCLTIRQQSSPAVRFARLRSNRRCKPGD